MTRQACLFLTCFVLFFAANQMMFVRAHSSEMVSFPQQQDKEGAFKEFNDKKRSDPNEAYKLAQSYLEKYGNDQDENTKYVKEWVVAYETVKARMAASGNQANSPSTSSTNTTKPETNAGIDMTKTADITGTTWQVKGKDASGNAWAEIFAFKTGGRFQYERYGADGSSNIWGGTWRKLGENIFATLLGGDGNTIGTIRAELDGGCLTGMLKREGLNDWQFLMETESAPDACSQRRQQRQVNQYFIDRINEGNRALESGQIDAAVNAFGLAQRSRPDRTESAIGLARAYGVGNPDQALAQLQVAVRNGAVIWSIVNNSNKELFPLMASDRFLAFLDQSFGSKALDQAKPLILNMEKRRTELDNNFSALLKLINAVQHQETWPGYGATSVTKLSAGRTSTCGIRVELTVEFLKKGKLIDPDSAKSLVLPGDDKPFVLDFRTALWFAHQPIPWAQCAGDRYTCITFYLKDQRYLNEIRPASIFFLDRQTAENAASLITSVSGACRPFPN